MKKAVGIIMIGAMVASMATSASAAPKREKKNEPKSKRTVEETLKALGPEHFPEKMKLRTVDSVKTDMTYYHIYSGALKGGYEYRVIVFDNTPKYLGYYQTEYDPEGCEEGAILFRTGGAELERIEITDKGPKGNPRLDGVLTKFIKAPEKKEKKFKKEESEEADGESSEPAFREWTITHGIKEIKVRAIYVSQTFGKVTLRAEASGKENAFPISSISEEDKAYIKQFK